jgi:hypothetical protein
MNLIRKSYELQIPWKEPLRSTNTQNLYHGWPSVWYIFIRKDILYYVQVPWRKGWMDKPYGYIEKYYITCRRGNLFKRSEM